LNRRKKARAASFLREISNLPWGGARRRKWRVWVGEA